MSITKHGAYSSSFYNTHCPSQNMARIPPVSHHSLSITKHGAHSSCFITHCPSENMARISPVSHHSLSITKHGAHSSCFITLTVHQKTWRAFLLFHITHCPSPNMARIPPRFTTLTVHHKRQMRMINGPSIDHNHIASVI